MRGPGSPPVSCSVSRCWALTTLVTPRWLHDIMWGASAVGIQRRPAAGCSSASRRERVSPPGSPTAEVAFPPAELSLLAFKDTRVVEVYARIRRGRLGA